MPQTQTTDQRMAPRGEDAKHRHSYSSENTVSKSKETARIGCFGTRVHKEPIIALYFLFENELKLYNLGASKRKAISHLFSELERILQLSGHALKSIKHYFFQFYLFTFFIWFFTSQSIFLTMSGRVFIGRGSAHRPTRFVKPYGAFSTDGLDEDCYFVECKY